MQALTLWQPWAWAVVFGPKRVENRDWTPPRAAIGQNIAIHAGMRWDQDGADFLADLGIAVGSREDHHFGAVFGVARLESFTQVLDRIPPDQHRFFFGRYGWILGRPRPLSKPGDLQVE